MIRPPVCTGDNEVEWPIIAISVSTAAAATAEKTKLRFAGIKGGEGGCIGRGRTDGGGVRLPPSPPRYVYLL